MFGRKQQPAPPAPIIGAENVPIVGQPIEAYECIPVVVMRCKCKDTNAPMTITGMNPSVCGECRNVYAIAQVMFDIRTGRAPAVGIAIVGVARKNEEQDGGRSLETNLVSGGEA